MHDRLHLLFLALRAHYAQVVDAPVRQELIGFLAQLGFDKLAFPSFVDELGVNLLSSYLFIPVWIFKFVPFIFYLSSAIFWVFELYLSAAPRDSSILFSRSAFSCSSGDRAGPSLPPFLAPFLSSFYMVYCILFYQDSPLLLLSVSPR